MLIVIKDILQVFSVAWCHCSGGWTLASHSPGLASIPRQSVWDL